MTTNKKERVLKITRYLLVISILFGCMVVSNRTSAANAVEVSLSEYSGYNPSITITFTSKSATLTGVYLNYKDEVKLVSKAVIDNTLNKGLYKYTCTYDFKSFAKAGRYKKGVYEFEAYATSGMNGDYKSISFSVNIDGSLPVIKANDSNSLIRYLSPYQMYYYQINATGNESGLKALFIQNEDGETLQNGVLQDDGSLALNFGVSCDSEKVVVTAEDNLGGITKRTVEFMFDDELPDIIAPSISDEWNTKPYKLSYGGKDLLTGVCSLSLYNLDYGTYYQKVIKEAAKVQVMNPARETLSSEYTFLDGIHDVMLTVEDGVGNKNLIKYQICVDTQAPTLTFDNGTTIYDDYSILVTDVVSGVKNVSMYINNKEVSYKSSRIDDGIKIYSPNRTNESIYQVKIVATDKAGNITTKTFSRKRDLAAPQGKLSFKFGIIKLDNLQDKLSGISKCEVVVSRNKSSIYTKKTTKKLNIKSDQARAFINLRNYSKGEKLKFTVYLYDKVGNERTYSMTYKVTAVDLKRKAPKNLFPKAAVNVNTKITLKHSVATVCKASFSWMSIPGVVKYVVYCGNKRVATTKKNATTLTGSQYRPNKKYQFTIYGYVPSSKGKSDYLSVQQASVKPKVKARMSLKLKAKPSRGVKRFVVNIKTGSQTYVLKNVKKNVICDSVNGTLLRKGMNVKITVIGYKGSKKICKIMKKIVL